MDDCSYDRYLCRILRVQSNFISEAMRCDNTELLALPSIPYLLMM